MGKILIERVKLQSWFDVLDHSPTSSDIFKIAEEIYDVLQQPDVQEKQKTKTTNGLTMREVIPGNIYEAFNIHGNKFADLNGKRVRVVKRNRTTVKISLVEVAGRFNIGDTFNIEPSLLRPV